MKISLALAVVILVIGIVPGLFQRRQLDHLREEHRTLVAAAVKLGITAPEEEETRQTKKQRADMSKQSAAIAGDILAFYLETGGWRAQDQAAKERGLELKARILAMDASALRQVISALSSNQDIPEEAKCDLIGSTLLHLTAEHPDKALDLVAQEYDILKGSAIGNEVIAASFQKWAEESPESALSWLRTNAEEYPDMAGEEAKRAVLSGTAVNDPGHALRLLGELSPADKSAAVRAIVASGCEDPEKRGLLLTALRQNIAAMGNLQERDMLVYDAFGSLARHLSKEGFESSSAWVDKAGFSPQEKMNFAAGLSYFTTRKDTGAWLNWIATQLPAQNTAAPVATLVSEWTQKDHQAAGMWLLAAQDGPAKIPAIRAYATAVAEFEPDVAVQWAMTLPAGSERESTLRTILHNWPASDPDGADSFAREHGLK